MSLTNQELDSRTRALEGALRGMPEGSCLYQYSRVLSGCSIPRKENYGDPVLNSFVNDRLEYLNSTADFRRIDLFGCLWHNLRRSSSVQAPWVLQLKDSSVVLAQLTPNVSKRQRSACIA